MPKIEFPKWIYPDAPETTRGRIVQNDAEEAEYLAECQVPVMNGDTSRSPQEVIEEAEATVEELHAALDAAGIEYDKRWGAKRLKALLPE